jgi:outer membrane protein assembly factor BamA
MGSNKFKIEYSRKHLCLFSPFHCLRSFRFVLPVFFLLISSLITFAQNQYENRRITRVDIVFEGGDKNTSAADQFRLVAGNALGDIYSRVKIRDALDALYETRRIVSAKVEARLVDDNGVVLRFIIKRKNEVKKVFLNIGNTVGEAVTEQQLLLRLNLLSPGSMITNRTLENNSTLILEYLRDRGFFDAKVSYDQQITENDTEVNVIFNVIPNTQAKVRDFTIEIENFDQNKILPELKLKTGSLFTREKLSQAVERTRSILQEEDYLAPRLDEPRVIYDDDTNTVDLRLVGQLGATVEVTVDSEKEKIGKKTQQKLLPIKREGTLNYSAIVEGDRRLENYFQEKGYFFARVTPKCSVDPGFLEGEASETENGTEVLCTALSGADLNKRKVNVTYEVNLNRQLKLVEIRLEGTEDLKIEGDKKLTIEEIQTVLNSQEANALGFIPYLGYGRGYTSLEILQQDRLLIRSLVRELGYRNAQVGIKQGVSPDGQDLIITFVVREGIPTIIKDVEIKDNRAFPDEKLREKLPKLTGKYFSRAKARNGLKKLVEYYTNAGYYDVKINYSIVELPDDDDPRNDEVKIIYEIENEGRKVFVNRILVNGNEITEREAILKAIPLKERKTRISPDEQMILRSTDIFTGEQNLYSSDAFTRVEIKPEPAGEARDSNNNIIGRLSDIIVNVEEQKPRLITYGGGFSTDSGPFGFFDVRHFNLLGKLQQGGAQIRISRRQQLVQFDFINPRFISDGKDKNGNKRFAPLTFSAQYQRDTTVTRFFRSTFDQGTFGIVQRIDENGNPIDEFGNNSGDPTINRLTLSAETQRTISVKDRSILFVKYRFEDVRLFNFESLLIKELLRPDAKVRISGFGATFVRDTRENCSIKYTLLEMIDKGEPGEPCRYNPGDPTRGDYLTAQYDVAVPFLGSNIGFHKFQASYNRYYTFKNTTLAARAILGLGSVFSSNQRFANTQFPQLSGSLPISERFFAGGSTNLRGFDFEGAGPRIAISPQGTFRNQQGEIVTLNPFTVPFGGNALAVVNLEARIPFTESIRVVPFYDGGNVFGRIGDIFNPANARPNNVFENNIRSVWSHTIGLGFRIKTPIGGEFAVDYGYLLNPPNFLIPQQNAPDAIFRLKQGQLHFRFSQAF